jgi:hypothetical protein
LWHHIRTEFHNVILSTLLVFGCTRRPLFSLFRSILFFPAFPRSLIRGLYLLRRDACRPYLAEAGSLAGRSVLTRSLARGRTTCKLHCTVAARVPELLRQHTAFLSACSQLKMATGTKFAKGANLARRMTFSWEIPSLNLCRHTFYTFLD